MLAEEVTAKHIVHQIPRDWPRRKGVRFYYYSARYASHRSRSERHQLSSQARQADRGTYWCA